MRHRGKRVIVLASTVAMASLISGCINKYDYSKIPLESPMTQQEVTDYYANQMSYKNVINRASNKDIIQWNSVPESLQKKLWEKTLKVIETHQLNNGYENDMTYPVHDYLKLVVDDLVLNKPEGGNFTYSEAESQGFYFVTVDFSTKLNGQGTFKDEANYLGIDGAIIDDYRGIHIDDVYLTQVMNKVNEARKQQRLNEFPILSMKLDNAQHSTTVVEQTAGTDADGNNVIGNIETNTEDTTKTDNTEQDEDFDIETKTPELPQEAPTNDKGLKKLYSKGVRQLPYDVKYINSTAGSSIGKASAIPNVTAVYNPTGTSGEISGYGIYSEGSNGLRDFGYSRDKYTGGKMQITFVFKQDSEERDKFDYSYCYINSYESGIEMEDKNITVSDYINTEIDKVIERADRAYSNRDATALMGKGIYDASDLGLKMLMQRNTSNILTNMSQRVKTLQRNPDDDREYLIELERTVEEAPSGFGNTARYKDKYYAVVQQDGTQFRINDMVLVSRQLERIPDPNADDSITRRLTSLNLSGEVPEGAKSEISNMFKQLYFASTNRVWNDQKEGDNIIVKDGVPQFGLASRFDSDRSLLSESRYNYFTSQLRNRLTKHTAKTKCKVTGQVTNWLGGYNDQVELTTEELYQYEGHNSGLYVQNYYLVSHYGTEWVIDDVKTIEEKEVSDNEYSELITKLGSIDETPEQ